MSALLEPDVARRLLLTAAKRQHEAAVEHMLTLPYMQRQVDVATLEVMLLELLKHHGCLSVLTQLPAAAQLSCEGIIRLLRAAAALGAYDASLSSFVLCQLPAAQQLDSAAVLQLLHVAVVQQGYVPRAVCELPAAQQFSSEEMFQLLQAAVQQGGDLLGLCIIPAAEQLTRQEVLQLLDAAVQCGNANCIWRFAGCQQPRSLASRKWKGCCRRPSKPAPLRVLGLQQSCASCLELDADQVVCPTTVWPCTLLGGLCVDCGVTVTGWARATLGILLQELMFGQQPLPAFLPWCVHGVLAVASYARVWFNQTKLA
jgi:hypothetical protein